MKNIIIVVLIFLTTAAFSQKKTDMQAQLDTLKKANQTLTDKNKSLTLQTDSLSKELTRYFGLYTVIKEKVVKMDFDPSRMANIIDSLKAGRDSLQLSSASSLLLRDTIKVMGHTIDSLKKEASGLLYAVNLLKGGAGVNPTDAKDFVGKWNFVLRKVKVIGKSPNAALIDITADPVDKAANILEINPVIGVNFVDAEVAELLLANGEQAKCFYQVVSFNKTQPYHILFKGTKAELQLWFMNTAAGTRVSFQVPGPDGVYYFGQMTK
jgi:regulator of replication initiation timing